MNCCIAVIIVFNMVVDVNMSTMGVILISVGVVVCVGVGIIVVIVVLVNALSGIIVIVLVANTTVFSAIYVGINGNDRDFKRVGSWVFWSQGGKRNSLINL